MRQTEEKNAANTVAKALIDIIAQCTFATKKSGSEFMRGHLINLQLHSLALKLSHNKYTKKGGSAQHKYTRSAIMPFCITRNRL
jgi:hypothetical protein